VLTVVLYSLQFNLSFSAVTSKSLTSVLRAAGGHDAHAAPTRYEFDNMLVASYQYCVTLVTATLAAAAALAIVGGHQLPFMHFMLDFWTAKHQNKGYGVALVAFINAEWELCVRAIGTSAVSGSKTSPVIVQFAEHVLRKATSYGLDAVISCTTDGASDNR
jgi:DhnA family fructose-bisphosphate aldolase class Ia